MVKFRVVTYNVLSSHLAEPSRFPECAPMDLEANVRLKRIKEKLELEAFSLKLSRQIPMEVMNHDDMLKTSVLCLQEVSTLWVGKLHTFFLKHDYAFITGNYGSKRSGYMGVAIAFPRAHFEVVDVDITRVSDTRTWGQPPQDNDPPEHAGFGALEFLMRLAGRGAKRRREDDAAPGSSGAEHGKAEEDHWQMAQRRLNQILFVRLRPKVPEESSSRATPDSGELGNGADVSSGRPAAGFLNGTGNGHPPCPPSRMSWFCVGTYHMPCLFNDRPVMVMHTSMAIKHLVRLAGGDPLVFAGDFNFNPDSECYKLVTEGDLDPTSPDFPERQAWEKHWSPATGVRLTSAYKEVTGAEPEFTNNAKVEQWPRFIDTLDYIFHTSGVRATKVLPLKHRDEVEGPYPSKTEPSDHVMLAAEYEVVEQEQTAALR